MSVKKVAAIIIVAAMMTVSFLSIGAGAYTNISEGIKDGVIVDYDAYQKAHPESFVADEGGAFGSLKELMDSYNKSKNAEIKTGKVTADPKATATVRTLTLTKTFNGKSYYDTSWGDDSWARSIGWITYNGQNMLLAFAEYRDDLFSDDVRTMAQADKGVAAKEYSAGVSSNETKWSKTIYPTTPDTYVMTYSPWVKLKDNNATFSAILLFYE